MNEVELKAKLDEIAATRDSTESEVIKACCNIQILILLMQNKVCPSCATKWLPKDE